MKTKFKYLLLFLFVTLSLHEGFSKENNQLVIHGSYTFETYDGQDFYQNELEFTYSMQLAIFLSIFSWISVVFEGFCSLALTAAAASSDEFLQTLNSSESSRSYKLSCAMGIIFKISILVPYNLVGTTMSEKFLSGQLLSTGKF